MTHTKVFTTLLFRLRATQTWFNTHCVHRRNSASKELIISYLRSNVHKKHRMFFVTVSDNTSRVIKISVETASHFVLLVLQSCTRVRCPTQSRQSSTTATFPDRLSSVMPGQTLLSYFKLTFLVMKLCKSHRFCKTTTHSGHYSQNKHYTTTRTKQRA